MGTFGEQIVRAYYASGWVDEGREFGRKACESYARRVYGAVLHCVSKERIELERRLALQPRGNSTPDSRGVRQRNAKATLS